MVQHDVIQYVLLYMGRYVQWVSGVHDSRPCVVRLLRTRNRSNNYGEPRCERLCVGWKPGEQSSLAKRMPKQWH